MAAQVRSEREETRGLQGGGFISVTPFGGEELVDDVRHGVTPAQMVERKLLALLGGGSPGLTAQAAGGASDPRRDSGGLA